MSKTLVILTPGFPENEADSNCIPPLQVFVKALKEEHPALNIVVLTFRYPFFSGAYEWHGMKVIAFGNRKNRRLYRAFTMLRVWLTLRKLHRGHQLIGLLSFWLDKCAFVGDAFAKYYQLPHYCWLLGQDAKAGNKFFRRIKPSGNSLIAISDAIARTLHQHYGVLPQHVIPVGINTTPFDTATEKKDIDILGAGSLIPLKQYHIFLEAVNAARFFLPDINTVICGDGQEMGRLRAMVKTMGLEKNVSLIGRQPHEAVLALMQRSKILLHPSSYEGFGVVCLEALSAGAKVISFVRPMDADIENWHIAADREEMVQLLITILQNPVTFYHPIRPYLIQHNARAVMQLFEQ
jgi:glycosyltransferase involved in cell wall biosynthesis